MNTLRFSLFSLIESRLHRVESKHYQDTLDNKIQVFLVEFTKLLENQNLVLAAQKSILLKLRHIEQGDNISNSGLNAEECLPCPEIRPIQQPTQQLQPELNIIKTKLQSLSDKLNRLGNPYRSVKLNTKEINDDLNKIKNDLAYFSENFNFFSQINNQLENLNNLYEEYKIIYIVYTILAAVLILVLIKILALVYYLLSLCKNCCQIIRDFQEFRNRQKQERQNYRHQERERAYPLVSYR